MAILVKAGTGVAWPGCWWQSAPVVLPLVLHGLTAQRRPAKQALRPLLWLRSEVCSVSVLVEARASLALYSAVPGPVPLPCYLGPITASNIVHQKGVRPGAQH